LQLTDEDQEAGENHENGMGFHSQNLLWTDVGQRISQHPYDDLTQGKFGLRAGERHRSPAAAAGETVNLEKP
jgi:hypothetical protein